MGDAREHLVENHRPQVPEPEMPDHAEILNAEEARPENHPQDGRRSLGQHMDKTDGQPAEQRFTQ
jgi:hypothetical protein